MTYYKPFSAEKFSCAHSGSDDCRDKNEKEISRCVLSVMKQLKSDKKAFKTPTI